MYATDNKVLMSDKKSMDRDHTRKGAPEGLPFCFLAPVMYLAAGMAPAAFSQRIRLVDGASIIRLKPTKR
jgi:hypothetical protein